MRKCSGALVLTLFLLQPSGAAQSAEPTAAELFNSYRLRQFETFTGHLVRVRDFDALRKHIAREGVDWPLEAKAAFLLETADAALQHRELTTRRGPEVELFEDACKAVRQLPPRGQFEEAWHSAASSVLSARYAAVISVDDHLKHIRGRFDEGRIAMVRAMRGSTVKLFEAARRFESVRAEATLRQAALLAARDRHGEALPLLGTVETLSDDPWLRYLAALLSGRSLEAVGRNGDAQLAYRTALSLQANGNAARLALASMVFSTGGREEADRLIGEALSERAGPPDPWTEFFDGDFRFLAVRRAAMRGQLQ